MIYTYRTVWLSNDRRRTVAFSFSPSVRSIKLFVAGFYETMAKPKNLWNDDDVRIDDLLGDASPLHIKRRTFVTQMVTAPYKSLFLTLPDKERGRFYFDKDISLVIRSCDPRLWHEVSYLPADEPMDITYKKPQPFSNISVLPTRPAARSASPAPSAGSRIPAPAQPQPKHE